MSGSSLWQFFVLMAVIYIAPSIPPKEARRNALFALLLSIICAAITASGFKP